MAKQILSILIFALLVFAPASRADQFDVLWRNFDADRLTYNEKRFLQASLAFEGLYNGLLDGEWGRISQSALDRYSLRESESGAANFHMATLAFRFVELWERDGWDFFYADPANVSLLFPFKTAVEGAPSEKFANWRHSLSTLGISIAVGGLEETRGYHDYTFSQHSSGGEPYSVRKPNFAVTSATSRDGSILYTRSDYVGGAWTTIMLSSEERDHNLLNGVSGSIVVGRAPSLGFPESGLLRQTIDLAVAFSNEGDEPDSSNSTARAPSIESEEPRVAGTGSAFVVSGDGHLLTNAHVVEGCKFITVDGHVGTVIETSSAFDLALLQAVELSGKPSVVFARKPAPLNLDVVVAGYPFSGILGGLNITRGTVSSLKGLGGSESTMQISAPVQPGNSGGPVLASDGTLVGVVVSKLDAAAVADATGDIPQNVNFAIRGELAQLFLFQNGVTPRAVDSQPSLDPVALGQRAQSVTKLVECIR